MEGRVCAEERGDWEEIWDERWWKVLLLIRAESVAFRFSFWDWRGDFHWLRRIASVRSRSTKISGDCKSIPATASMWCSSSSDLELVWSPSSISLQFMDYGMNCVVWSVRSKGDILFLTLELSWTLFQLERPLWEATVSKICEISEIKTQL